MTLQARCCLSALGVLLSACGLVASAQEPPIELNAILMKSTFELAGPAAGGKTTFGTVFVIGKPLKDNPNRSWNVLVTAAHVLDEVLGDKATLFLHHKNSDGTFTNDPFEISIRNNGKNLYVTNPDADVATMYLPLKEGAMEGNLPMSVLATDETLKSLEIPPGDELLCLGFPAAVNLNSFPVIRSGVLASYPLTPSKTVKIYFYNFRIFPGNSGGPVYFSYYTRQYGGALHGGSIQGVVGLVTQQVNSTLPEYSTLELDISRIVPSSFIIDTINMLPDIPDPAH
jgi:hypothetical protein